MQRLIRRGSHGERHGEVGDDKRLPEREVVAVESHAHRRNDYGIGGGDSRRGNDGTDKCELLRAAGRHRDEIQRRRCAEARETAAGSDV